MPGALPRHPPVLRVTTPIPTLKISPTWLQSWTLCPLWISPGMAVVVALTLMLTLAVLGLVRGMWRLRSSVVHVPGPL